MKLAEVEDHMQQSIEAVQRSFNTVRTGRANASLLDRVMVDYYGSPTPLKTIASINTPDASTITIQPFDPSSLGAIEKAIQMSDVGLTPNNDGSIVRLNVPPLTAERRKEMVKIAAKIAEEGKVAVRNIRRDAIDSVRKQAKSSDISEDESRDLQDSIQQVTDKFVKKIDQMLTDKEADITKV